MLFRMVKEIKVSSDWFGCEKKAKKKSISTMIRLFLLLSLIPEKICKSKYIKFSMVLENKIIH